jgi:ribosome-associated protein
MDKQQLFSELQFKAVRSSGAGGQHVNKVSSKIELALDVFNSQALSNIEKERIYLRLGTRLTKENILLLQCDESRSQHKNKELVKERLMALLEKAIAVPKKRRKTKPSRSAIEKRLKSKLKKAQKKANRLRPDME